MRHRQDHEGTVEFVTLEPLGQVLRACLDDLERHPLMPGVKGRERRRHQEARPRRVAPTRSVPPSGLVNSLAVRRICWPSLANPSNAALQQTVAVVFKGTTLRVLLLNGYAFGTIATIAGWSAVVAFVGAGLMLILSVLGFLHAYGKIGRKSAEPTATA